MIYIRPLLAFMLAVLSVLPICAASPQHSPVSEQIRYEVRAVWLTTLMGLDWPRRTASTPEATERQKTELCTMLDRLQEAGINTVFFQSRIRATTAYASSIEPWDGVFTGKAGQAPAYDPLQFAVSECHKRGMECHAWVVAFPICKASVAKQLGKKALPAQHPELCRLCGDQWMMDPGVPETADYLAAVCREITENYAVDGIHLDYIRYPESAIPFNDSKTYARYSGGKNKAEWRRDNVNRCVRKVHDAVKSVRPWVKLSCSPVGKYSDLSRYSSHGWNARDAVSQDAQLWLREGWMDMLFPMMYFDGDHYYPFLADWKEHEGGGIVAPGLGIYFLSEKEKNWPLLSVQRQMNVARSVGLEGQAFFRAKFLLDNVKGLYTWLRSDFYADQALIPPIRCKGSDAAPSAPKVQKRMDGLRLSLRWDAVPGGGVPVYYNVYRLDSVRGDRLLASRIAETHYETTLALPALKHSRYVVTAVDAYGRESLGGEQ